MLSSVLLDNSRLEATMDRRTFIRLVAGSAACSFVGGAVPAGAEELDDCKAMKSLRPTILIVH